MPVSVADTVPLPVNAVPAIAVPSTYIVGAAVIADQLADT
jgi:hypothetical protein